MKSDKKTARLAGFFYLLVILFGSFAELFVRSKLIVPGNAIESAQNIMANESLFRIGFVSDLMMQLAFFCLPLVLYRLLKSVHKFYAGIMVLSALASVVIMCINMLNHYAVLLLLNGSEYIGTFSPAQLNSLMLFFLDLHKHGYRIAQIFFGLWLLPLGYLVFKSGFIPRILGILLIIAFASFMIDFFFFFLIPNYDPSISAMVTFPTVIGEFAFCLWLLIKGVRNEV